jgi:hypothetical protein
VASTLKGHQRPNNTSLAKRNTKKQGQRIEQQIKSLEEGEAN